jgi:hypothetical protein
MISNKLVSIIHSQFYNFKSKLIKFFIVISELVTNLNVLFDLVGQDLI